MVIWTFLSAGCAVIPERSGSKQPASPDTAAAASGTTSPDAGPSDPDDATETGDSAEAESPPSLEGTVGALVTTDCTYEGYGYAVDILLSCGDERFGEALRLHTFKRHSHDHQKVFSDQRLTVRDAQLWFDGYSTPRCVRVDGRGRLQLETRADACSRFEFPTSGTGIQLQDAATGLCAGLGTAACGGHEWTGGRECGGIDHRYLPLVMGDCADGLGFAVEQEADACGGEYPGESCF